MKDTIKIRPIKHKTLFCIIIIGLFLIVNLYPVLGVNPNADNDISTSENANFDMSSRSTLRAEDWSKDRGDLSNTGYSPSLATDVKHNLWKHTFDSGYELYSSPVVAGDKVYIGSTDRSIYALDMLNGSIVWSRSTTNLGGPLSGDEIVSSAAVANGMLFIGCSDKNLFALDAETGTFIWNYTTGGEIQGAPAVADNLVLVGSFDGRLYALQASTGKAIWEFNTGYKIRSTPAIVEDVVFIGTESADGAGKPCVYALDITNGNEIWNYTTSTGKGVSTSIAVGNNEVFFGGIDRKVYALNKTTGDELWNFTTGGSVYSSPALDLDNNVLYVGSDDTKLYAAPMVDPDGDGEINSTEMYWTYDTNDRIRASPSIADGKVFFGNQDGEFYALNATTQPLSVNKRNIWNFGTQGLVESSAAVANGIVFIASDSGSLWALASTDLEIYNHEVKVYDLHPFETERVQIKATVYNNGTIELNGSLKFTDYDENSPIPKKILIEEHDFILEVGESVTLTSEWIAVVGEHDMAAQINRSSHADSNTDNNLAFWQLDDDVPPLYSDGWGMFQNDTAHTGLSWLAPRTNKTEWTYKSSGPLKSSVAIAKSRVFLTSTDGKIYALNEQDGSDMWNYSVGAPIYTSPAFIASGIGSSEYDKIFLGADDGSVYAFNMNDGTLLWSYATGNDVRASPMVINGIVYIGSTDGALYALDEDGQTDGDQGVIDTTTANNEDMLWSRSIGSISGSSPAALLEEDKLYIGTDEGRFYALDRFTDATVWERNFGTNAALKGSPAIGDGLIYIGTGDGKFYALDSENGDVVWEDPTGGSISSSPAIDSENNIVIVGSDDGNVYAYVADSGDRLWVYSTGGMVRSSPVIADERVFVGSGDQYVYCLEELGNGDGTTDLIWSFKADEKIFGSPTISNNGLYIGTESGMLYRLGSPNVPPVAKITAPANQSVYFTDEDIIFDASESSDLEDIELHYNWTSERVVQLAGQLPKVVKKYIYDGNSPIFNATLPEGDHLIILRVTDPMFGISNATTNITVFQPKTEYFSNSTIPADCSIYYGGKGTVEITETTNPSTQTTGSVGLFNKFQFESLTPRYKIGNSNITISLDNANIPDGLNLSRLRMYTWDTTNRNWVKVTNSGFINLSNDEIRVWAQGDDLVTPHTTLYSPGTYDNSPPELEIEGDGVFPQEGSDYNTFTYRVTYTDPDDDGPLPAEGGNIWVNINGIPYKMVETDSNDTDYSNGKEYQFQIDGAAIGIGTTNTYYFAAHDGTYKAIGDTIDQSGPVVILGTPVADAGDDLIVDEDEAFRLDGSDSYDEDGTIDEYYWDMDASVDSDGDGIFDNDKDAIGVEPTWKYTESGEFIVTLIIVDDQGASDNDTITITVEPKEDEDTIDNEFVFYSIIIVIIVIIILIIVMAILRKRMKEEEDYKKFKRAEEEEEEEDIGEEEEFECPRCGALLAADDDACPECGEEFEEEEE